MAEGHYAKPGTEFGPCVPGCTHQDCMNIRKRAAQKCRLCSKVIGYQVGFYNDPENEGQEVHAVCLERFYEAKQNE